MAPATATSRSAAPDAAICVARCGPPGLVERTRRVQPRVSWPSWPSCAHSNKESSRVRAAPFKRLTQTKAWKRRTTQLASSGAALLLVAGGRCHEISTHSEHSESGNHLVEKSECTQTKRKEIRPSPAPNEIPNETAGGDVQGARARPEVWTTPA